MPHYSAFKSKYNYFSERKHLTNISSPQSQFRTKAAITKNNRFKPTNGAYSNLLPCYFEYFKRLAIVTHKTYALYYACNGIAEHTFTYYLNGHFKKIDVVRLFNLFAYFRFNTYMVERLKAIDCDIESLTFERFISLDGLPLPNGESYSVAIDYLALLPESFPNPDEIQTPKRKNYKKKVK